MRCGAPRGYNIVDFDGASYTVRYKASSLGPDHQIRVWLPDGLAASESASGEVVANVFAGNEKSRSWFRVNNGPWTAMRHDIRQDPHMLEIKKLEQSETPPNGRSIPDPWDSHHIWSAPLPAGLEPGYHAVEVKSVDMFGAEHRATSMLRLAE